MLTSDPLKGSAFAHGGNPQDRTASPRRRKTQGNARVVTRDNELKAVLADYKRNGNYSYNQ
jgi:hypothetical protein